MSQITSGIGLISGINTGQIIDELISLDSQPVTLLQTRVTAATSQKSAYAGLLTKLQSLQTIGQALERPTTFAAATATSTDPTVLTGTAAVGAPPGSYQFQVAQLVSAQQSVSNGFTSATAPLQAGTFTIELGGGNLDPKTALAALNGGAGLTRGQFRITDRSGNTDIIDTSTAITLDDVVRKINHSLNINVRASVQNDHLILTDSSTGSGSLRVVDLADGTSAQGLGIAGTASGNTLTGSLLNYLGTNAAISVLNDGRGIRRAGGTGDFSVTTANGSVTTVNLGPVQTVGDLLTAINTAGAGKFKASIGGDGKSIALQDLTAGGGSFTVAALNGSNAASDLGILKTGAAGTISGNPVLAGIDSVLLRSLAGGAGLQLGQLALTDRAGNTATVNLSGTASVQDVLDAINSSSAHVTASLNASGTGIQLRDNSGGTGNLVVADSGGGTTAEKLGLAGSFDATQSTVTGSNLQLQWVSETTSLKTYNGGKGVNPGSFKITNAAGVAATVDLTQGTFNSIGDVISAINAKNVGVTASINANGNGILLTDRSTGAGHLRVANVTGTAATDLNIAGTATANTIDGSYEKTIQVAATDTLTTLQAKIQSLGFGVAANIVNDGSGLSPYRLSLTAFNTGTAGRVVIDGGTTGVQVRNLVDGQDSAVFFGGASSAQPLLITSSTNQLTGVIPGVTVSLQSASDKAVTLNISRDSTSIATQLQSFTDTFNGLIDSLNTLTTYDTTKQQGGLLLGDSTAQQIQTEMYTVFNSVVKDAGTVRTLGDVGLTLTDGAKISFDSAKFTAAFGQDPVAVKTLFTETATGLGAVIDSSMKTLVDPVNGAIPRENQTLDATTQQFQDRITQLNQLLADKKARLQAQFANMESVLAGLQGQQAALGSLSSLATFNTSAAATNRASTASAGTTPSTTAA